MAEEEKSVADRLYERFYVYPDVEMYGEEAAVRLYNEFIKPLEDALTETKEAWSGAAQGILDLSNRLTEAQEREQLWRAEWEAVTATAERLQARLNELEGPSEKDKMLDQIFTEMADESIPLADPPDVPKCPACHESLHWEQTYTSSDSLLSGGWEHADGAPCPAIERGPY